MVRGLWHCFRQIPRARGPLALTICYALAGAHTLANSNSEVPDSKPIETPARIDPEKPFEIGEEFYPKESVNAREEGKCLVKMMVDKSGNIHDPTIVTSSGFARLDAACIAAASFGHLLPATRNGVPVDTTATMPIDWKLPATLVDCMNIPSQDLPPIADAGSATKPKPPITGKVILRLFVAKTGHIEGVKIAQSSGYPRLDDAGIKAVTGQKMMPATSDGHPIAACVTMPIVFNLK
jgi:TonB family protein